MHPRTAPEPATDSGDVATAPATTQATRKRTPRWKPAPDAPLTGRQRPICRTYFAYGCRTKLAADALGFKSARRVREVKATAAGMAYLEALEAQACAVVTTAQAARSLAPILT